MKVVAGQVPNVPKDPAHGSSPCTLALLATTETQRLGDRNQNRHLGEQK